ncbi:nucleotide sugar dehydrogenase [Colletotrichum navitas]|uniref:UDP-glucose 6-dehydrogenase n=1 Tax=Colletotrichum navitas TaxID=681940 RepID=A0AAD8UV18_9PEZI|nr:nucleotide sugar dehydrogenase [Colletotrichum navitas]KAK1564188.1 nucleotide sugar dehydrogenase [Colletotrichum navitas]
MSLSQKKKTIACIGAGYVGGPTSAVLALQIPEIDVYVLDKSESRVASWNSERLPISEPGLYDVVRATRERPKSNLFFSTDIGGVIPKADIIFICVETPSILERGGDDVAGAAPDLTSFNVAVQRIGSLVTKNAIVVNKSTVPCGSAEETAQLLQSRMCPGIKCEVLSNPEFLAEGTAVDNLLNPDRVLIGCSSSKAGKDAAAVLGGLYARWVPRERIVTMDTRSSELAKLAANMFLSQRISSINALSAMCDELGADITQVSRACGLDQRIGPHMLRASIGFGGSCFQKDVLHLVHTAKSLALDEVAGYLGSIVSLNRHQTERLARRMLQRGASGAGLETVAVLGFAFKPNTGDTRNSPSISFVRSLILNGVFVKVFDPIVPKSIILGDVKSSLYGLAFIADSRIAVSESPYEACGGANAVAILNPWDALQYDVDQGASGKSHCKALFHESLVRWENIARSMKHPKLLFDGHNFLNQQITSLGFQLERVGRLSPARATRLRNTSLTRFLPRASL